jgi:hypothetical protein
MFFYFLFYGVSLREKLWVGHPRLKAKLAKRFVTSPLTSFVMRQARFAAALLLQSAS